ncbi:MAG: LOG family protein [Deltaproteobacteria bacterium]|nr:LOG family protein [Deltaproteobacteria bacterium]
MNRPRRRYELRSDALNQAVDALVAQAREQFGGRDDDAAEYARQMVVTALRFLRDDPADGDFKLVNAAMKELRHALRVFAPYESVRKVSVFGSARTLAGAPDWVQAERFAEAMARRGWMIITGAGGGIMQAAQGGAGRDASFGVNIRLPFEQAANEVIAGDAKLVNFRYFFTRKVSFVRHSHAIALFPGGFGTHDEGFEALTLIQTGKSEMLPVVFVDAPGGDYWRDWAQYVDEHLLGRKLISPDDVALFRVTDSVDEAVAEVTRFYRNYHSSRYVGDRLVLRVQEAPSGDALAALSREFADLLVGGAIEASGALPEEGTDAVGLARLVLRFDRKSTGRLRRLIDRVNEIAPRGEAAARAAAHQIVPAEMPADAEREEAE